MEEGTEKQYSYQELSQVAASVGVEVTALMLRDEQELVVHALDHVWVVSVRKLDQ